MAERLVVLGSSDRPDVYFNIIAHEARTGTGEFVVALVGDDRVSSLNGRAQSLRENLTEFIRHLRTGSYAAVHAGQGLQPPVALADPEPMRKLFDEVDWGLLRIQHVAVAETDLKEFLREHARYGAAFDVTACGNSALAGSVAWLVSRGGSTINTFEQLRAPSYGEHDLLPYLAVDEFRYRDLSQGKLIRAALRRVNAGTIHRRSLWFLALGCAIVVAVVTALVPPALATPVITAAAAIATIMSALAVFVRPPD